MRFRDKSFTRFLCQQGFPIGMWLMLIFGGLLAFGVTVLAIVNHRLPIGGIILAIGFGGLYLFFNWGAYLMYKKGYAIVKEFRNDDSELLENIRIYVKNFDLLSVKKRFPPDLNKTIYDFDYADLLLIPDGLFLFGKNKDFMIKGYAAPVELFLHGSPNYPNSAQIVSIQEFENQRIELSIKDRNYKNELILQFDSHDKIKTWLARHKNVIRA